MLDHIIGSLYSLNHYGVSHGAVRPNLIVIDEEGKFILVDRVLFANHTNLQLMSEIIEKKDNSKIFLAPEELATNNRRRTQKQENHSEKSDIFCLALVVLEMCTLEIGNKYY